MEINLPEEIPNNWDYWEMISDENISIDQSLKILENLAKNEDFLIDGVDFYKSRNGEITNNKERTLEWSNRPEAFRKYIRFNFPSKKNPRKNEYNISHKVYDSPYTGTPEKKHLLEFDEPCGQRMEIYFTYGPKSNSERKLFWNLPEKLYQESDSDKN